MSENKIAQSLEIVNTLKLPENDDISLLNSELDKPFNFVSFKISENYTVILDQ